MMLTKVVTPKTKAELIRALQAASFRSVDVYEGEGLVRFPSIDRLQRAGSTVIVIT